MYKKAVSSQSIYYYYQPCIMTREKNYSLLTNLTLVEFCESIQPSIPSPSEYAVLLPYAEPNSLYRAIFKRWLGGTTLSSVP